MSKVKLVGSSVAGSGTALKKKPKNVAPSRVVNGKIQKKPMNAKGEGGKNVFDDAYINKYLEIQSKTRLCFVNIKCEVSMLNGSSSKNSISDESGATTSQAQYKDNDRKTNVKLQVEPTVVTSKPIFSRQRKVRNDQSVVEASKVRDSDWNNDMQSVGAGKVHDSDRNNNDISDMYTSRTIAGAFSEHNIKTGAAKLVKKCVVKLRRVSLIQAAEELNARKAKDVLLASQIISPTLDQEKRNAFRKLSLAGHSNTVDKHNGDHITETPINGKSPEAAETTTNLENIPMSTSKSTRSLRLRAATKVSQTTGNSTIYTDIKAKNNIKVNDKMPLKINKKNEKIAEKNATHRGKKTSNKESSKDLLLSTPLNEGKENQAKSVPAPVPNSRLKQALGVSKGVIKTGAPDVFKSCLKKFQVKISKNTTLTSGNVSLEKTPKQSCLSKSNAPVRQIENKTAAKEVVKTISENAATKSNDSPNNKPSKMVNFLPQRNSTMCNDENNTAINSDIVEFRVPEPLPTKSRQTLNETLGKINTKQTKLIGSKVKTTPTVVDFKPQNNSTECLEHMDVSAVLESNDETSEKGAVARNVQLNGKLKTFNSTQNCTNVCNKTNKFFHRQETNKCSQEAEKQAKHKDLGFRKLRAPNKRSSQVRREEVYEFLSQSQTSDSEGVGGTKRLKPTDPTADIIKKLIAEGKVAVATNRKGKGKPIMKRINRKPRKVAAQKVLKPKGIEKNAMANRKPIVKEANANDFPDYLAEDHFMDNNDDDDVPHTEIGNANIFNNVAAAQSSVNIGLRHSTADQEGTFSNLARSVLINQAGRTDPQRLKAQRLLAMAKKLISTPKNKNAPSIEPVEFSPIPRPATKPSPWRVDEDNNLPRVFNFSRSSGNLPSFSSDFIPSTPRKDKPNVSQVQVQTSIPESRPSQLQDSPSLRIIEGISVLPNNFSTPHANNVNSSIPSFSSNDSNAENKTPPKTSIESQAADAENDNIFNLKQLPNPRRALNYRSPLKAINIMEVVQLPPLSISNIISVAKKLPSVDSSNNDEKSTKTNNNFKTPQKPPQSKLKTIPNDLFGFEEFLSQSGLSSQEGSQSDSDAPPPVCDEGNNNDIMHEKLLGLRKFKPDSTDLQLSLQKTEATKEKLPVKNKYLFNDVQHISKPQKTVKEMLSSTRLSEKPTTSRKALEEQNRHYDNYRREEESNTSEMLFRDMEPETTFNEEDPHRTYIRPYKRKRRLREDRLIFAFDSDDSDCDNDSERRNRAAHKSLETTDSSSEQLPHKKRKRKYKEKPELVHFVEDFNEMCKDVEKYELVVEKSA